MAREVIMDNGNYAPNGIIQRPQCCDQPMEDDGGCSEGCCDDWKCTVCGKQIRIECAQ